MFRNYSELSQLETFMERYQYLELKGILGKITFGFDRWINQGFYKSSEWKSVRDLVIVRDNGCDLGIPEREVYTNLIVHHMNPLSKNDIKTSADILVDPEFLITTSLQTHNAIHFGDESRLARDPVVRKVGDTKLW